MKPILTVRGLSICFEAIAEDEEEAKEDLRITQKMSEKDIEEFMSTHKCFTAVVSGWRRGMCVADETISMCWEEDEDVFWQNKDGSIRHDGYFKDMMDAVVAEAEKKAVISEPRKAGYKPMSLIEEFVYLDDSDVMRWCPRSEESRARCGYDGYKQFDKFMNSKNAHAAVAEPEFTFMGEMYIHMEVKKYLRHKQREYDENNQRAGEPAE
jgi:hypothetical protein